MAEHNLIFIHGAWQGSWVWQGLLPFIEASHRRCYCIDLPGNGSDSTPLEQVNLDGYVDTVLAQIDAAKRETGVAKCVLIAHSGAGVIATQVADCVPESVAAVVYIAGMMLPSGLSFKTMLDEMLRTAPELSGIETFLEWRDEGLVSTVPVEAGAAIFLNDIAPLDALVAARQLTPQATGGLAIAANWRDQGFGQLPRLYIECKRDLSVQLPVQRHMQALVPGAEVVTLDAGHAPQVSMPETLATVLIDYLASLTIDSDTA